MEKINHAATFATYIILFAVFLSCQPTASDKAATSRQKNVLFIAIDDLRPALGCYGKSQIKSPNIDKLADEGLLFERAYCQVPVCGASRASLLSGIRPTRQRFVTFYSKVEDEVPGVVSLPEHFKNNGYHTISLGKIFHHGDDCEESWSEPEWRPSWRSYVTSEAAHIMQQPDNVTQWGWRKGPAYEAGEVPDSAYSDGKTTIRAIEALRKMKKQSKPFFLAVGFYKPHLPFTAPKKYWDMYNPDKITLADNPNPPENVPEAAMHNFIELRDGYANIPAQGDLSPALSRNLIHGYYACISYIDAQVGMLMQELEDLGMKENTTIVLWGDHGWHLGEHGLWCKHCNFEKVLRAPLIINDPEFQAKGRSSKLVEFVDIYPTLSDLCNLDLPRHLQGKSLKPLMENPDAAWDKVAISRYYDGVSVRTNRYRYTEWVEQIREEGYGEEKETYARMLYDLEADPDENINIAELPKHQVLVDSLSKIVAKQH